MSESVRELLILAGIAAQYPVAPLDSSGAYMRWTTCGKQWNPLDDDGDALRLSVSLMITVAQSPFGVEARILGGSMTFEGWGDDRMAATRRAIVRAAAEIGKATA